MAPVSTPSHGSGDDAQLSMCTWHHAVRRVSGRRARPRVSGPSVACCSRCAAAPRSISFPPILSFRRSRSASSRPDPPAGGGSAAGAPQTRTRPAGDVVAGSSLSRGRRWECSRGHLRSEQGAAGVASARFCASSRSQRRAEAERRNVTECHVSERARGALPPTAAPRDQRRPATPSPAGSPEWRRDPCTLPGCHGTGSMAASMVVPAPGRNRATPSRERRSRHTASGPAENPAGAEARLKGRSSGPTGSQTGREPMCRRRGSGGRTVATRRVHVVMKAGAVMAAAQG